MKRPWQVWLSFAVCAIVVLTTMWWFSSAAIRGDTMRQRAEFTMQREQQISLALWRMDTKLAPLIAEEAARPHYLFDSFYAADGSTQAGLSSNWNASPLLFQNKNVRLNFDNALETNQWTSPQVPSAEFSQLAIENGLDSEQIVENRRRLAELAKTVDPKQLLERLPKERIPSPPRPILSASVNSPAAEQIEQVPANQAANPFGQSEGPPTTQQPNQSDEQVAMQQQIALPQAKFAKGKQPADYGQRRSRYQGVAQQEFAKQRGGYGGYGVGETLGEYGGEFGGEFGGSPAPSTQHQAETVIESLSKPLWVNGELLLARRILRNDRVDVQGSWLDWPQLKQDLLAEVVDLFPRAELRPLADVDEGDPARMLAGLPVEIVLPPEKRIYLPSDALRWTLGFGWLALLIALAAVAALLWGVLALSERRAAFVSSVTHELRTPLTTFRMYADMLARDMVPDTARRQEYLTTLQREAERLTHLVENVLSYARLERGRGPSSREQIDVGTLLDRQQARLSDRAAQADMQFEVALPDELRELQLTTDVGVVEQILFNLVDNAAKYAQGADDPTISCAVDRDERFVTFTIRDSGPGFEQTRQARNPKPFSKTAEQAAVTKPGVGLGLALCRRLAVQLGGKLEIGSDSPGAVVQLLLPLG